MSMSLHFLLLYMCLLCLSEAYGLSLRRKESIRIHIAEIHCFGPENHSLSINLLIIQLST